MLGQIRCACVWKGQKESATAIEGIWPLYFAYFAAYLGKSPFSDFLEWSDLKVGGCMDQLRGKSQA